MSATGARTDANYRYALVFLLVVILLVFEVLSPSTAWARGIDIAISGAALAVAVGTSRARGEVRRLRATVVTVAVAVLVIGIGTGILPAAVALVIATAILAALPVTLAGGLTRLIRSYGVTNQAVAGVLTIYLIVGLLFASIIAFIANIESGPFFTQTDNAPNGVRVYYSFTVLTTTGFGDYTAAHSSGRALAVLEMLTGQIYLVTVIGIAVGNFAGRGGPRRKRESPDSTTLEST